MKRLFLRRRSVILTWLFSYITVLMLPIALSGLVYIVSSRTLEDEIHEANHSLLSQAREVMDNYFLSMERLTFEMMWNVRVRDLLYSNKYLSYPNDYPYDLYQISQDLLLYQSAYQWIDLFYIYLSEPNTVVMPALVRDGPYAYRLLHNDEALTYDAWLSVVNADQRKGFIPMVRIGEDGRKRKTVAYLNSYPSDTGKPAAMNITMIDQSRLLNAITNVSLFNKGLVYILNEHNQTLITNADSSELREFPFERMQESSGLFYFQNGDQKYEALYMKSTRSGLTYLSLIPSNLYWEKAELIRNLTYLSMLISLLGGGLLTTFFLRRNYNPVRRLVQAFSGKPEAKYDREINEFHYIQRAVDNTLGKIDSMELKLEQQRHILRSNFIARLMKGRIDPHIPLEDSLSAFRMHFDSDMFAVILFYVEDSEAFNARFERLEDADKPRMLQFIVTNIVEELADQHNRGYITEIDESIACLICFREQEDRERKADLRRIAAEAQRFLAEHYHIHLTLSISGIHQTVSGITHAYQECLDAMEYKLVMGRKEILAYEDIHPQAVRESDAGYYYPLQLEQQLINYVKSGDFEKASLMLEHVIDANLNRPIVSVPIAKFLLMNLGSTLMKTISEVGVWQESFIAQHPKRLERLAACDSLQEMKQELMALLKDVCDYSLTKRQQAIQDSRKQALHELVDRVAAYVEEHYHDPNLNISMIGHHFDMKPGYLSKLYKDHTGEGLLETINRVRIERAKVLIVERDKSIGDISLRVGFNDVNSFIRAFKKLEGVTPGAYKDSLHQS